MELDKIYNMDAFDGMKQIPDKSVNLAIIDLLSVIDVGTLGSTEVDQIPLSA